VIVIIVVIGVSDPATAISQVIGSSVNFLKSMGRDVVNDEVERCLF
jgi:hypothetical protein